MNTIYKEACKKLESRDFRFTNRNFEGRGVRHGVNISDELKNLDTEYRIERLRSLSWIEPSWSAEIETMGFAKWLAKRFWLGIV